MPPPLATKLPLVIWVVKPASLKSVPPLMPVTLYCVISAPSAALRVIAMAPESVSSLIAGDATLGVSATAVTVTVAVAAEPATVVPLVDASTLKLPLLMELAVGVNLRPALPSAKVMNALLAMAVVPSTLYRVPPAMPLILKCVVSTPSAALRLITRSVADCVSSLVVALVTAGVSATGVRATVLVN